MADDESWLYGEEGEGGEEEQAVPEQTPDQSQEEQVVNEDSDEESDDDGFQVTIDKEKIKDVETTYQTIGLKKNNVTDLGFVPAPPKEKRGRFAVEDFDHVMTINGQPSVEYDVEAIEEKPWRKPGADVTDYFNYGFTEDTWQAYCTRQKKMRINESGTGLLTGSTHIVTANKGAGGNIPILGAKKDYLPTVQKESAPSGITVMTHDKRVYSQKVIGNMDFTVPPPGVPPPGVPAQFSLPPPGVPPPTGGEGLPVPPPGTDASVPPPMGEFPPGDPFGEFSEGGADYYGGYEPTAEAQWTVPPPATQWTAPPGEHHYPGANSGGDRYGRRRDSRDDRSSRDWDRRSGRRRSRSRSRERSDRDRRDRDRDRDREDRDRRIKKEKRSRSRSRSPKHKKSKKDKKDKDEKTSKDKEGGGSKEIKEEPKD